MQPSYAPISSILCLRKIVVRSFYLALLECRLRKCRSCSSVPSAARSTTSTGHSGSIWRRTTVLMPLVSCARSTALGNLHECDQCEKKYKSREALLHHRQTAHVEAGQHKCDECGKLCPHKVALRRHKRRVHSDSDFECPVCGKKTRLQSSSQHTKTHAGEEQTVKNIRYLIMTMY